MLKNLEEMGIRQPLPEGLRSRLLAIPEEVSQEPGSWPSVPQQPLPRALRRRLLQIPESSRRPSAPPEWLLNTRYAAAASLLLAAVTMSAFGNPVSRGQETAGVVTQIVKGTYTALRDKSTTALSATGESVQSSYASTRQSVLNTVTDLSGRWAEIAATVRQLTENESVPAGTDPSPDPSAGEDKENENGKQRDNSTE